MLGIFVTAFVVGVGFLIALGMLAGDARSFAMVWPRAMAFAPGIGMGWTSLALFFALHFGLGRSILWLLVPLPAAVSVAWLAKSSRRRAAAAPRNERIVSEGRAAALPRAILPKTLVTVSWMLAAGLLYVMLGHAWVAHQINPLGTFDGVAIWNAHAAFLYRPAAGFQELFRTLEQGHPEYPLLLPGAIAGQFVFLGQEDPIIPQMTAMAFFLGLTMMIWHSVAALGSKAMALPAALVVLSTPAVSNFSFSQSADLPVAYFALGAAFGLCSQLPGGGRLGAKPVPSFLAGLFVGFLAWTKNEGVILALLILAVFLLTYPRSRPRCRRVRRSWRMAVAVAAGVLPAFLALVVFRVFWASTREAQAFLGGIAERAMEHDRWLAIAHAFKCRLNPFCEPDEWGFFWVLCFTGGLLILWRGTQSLRHTFLISFFLLSLMVYLSFYLITPHDVEWHLRSSVDRLLLQLAPLLAVWVFAAIQQTMPSSALATNPR